MNAGGGRSHTYAVRGTLLATALALGALMVYGVREAERLADAERRRVESVAYYDRVFDSIPLGCYLADVHSLLGYGESWIGPSGWPRSLGEVPGFADGMPLQVSLAGPVLSVPVGGSIEPTGPPRGFAFRVRPEAEVLWRVWRVPGVHQWVAVGFINDGSGGTMTEPRAIAKRSGRDDPATFESLTRR